MMSATTTSATPLEDEARAAIERGWALTPLEGKIPKRKKWQSEEPLPPDELLQWAAHDNLGLRTGAISGLVVVDVDDGADLSELDLPDTPCVVTGNSGLHFYYSLPDGVSVGNSVQRLGTHIDVRGDGGQVVCAGSVHPKTGQVYYWAEGKSPDDIDIVPFPDHLLHQLNETKPNTTHTAPQEDDDGTKNPYVQKALEGELAAIHGAPKGQRNDTVYRAACSLGGLVHTGEIDEKTISHSLLGAALAAGLSDKEARDTIESGIKKGVANPRDVDGQVAWPEPRPLPDCDEADTGEAYPAELLPPVVRSAAVEVARFTKTPEVSASVIGLAVIAAAIGKRATIEERPGLPHHPACFFSLIAASGERKSQPFKLMCHPLEEWTNNKQLDYERRVRKSKASDIAIDAQIGSIKSKAKKADADTETLVGEIEELEKQRVPLPPHPRPFTTDATEQRLFQKMHDHAGAYAVLSGEGRDVFDSIMGKYSGEGRTGEAIYLKGISGDTITRDRVGGGAAKGPEERVIYDPCLVVCVMVQPDKYREVAAHPSLRSSGALARIWPVWLPSMAGKRIEEKGEQGLNPLQMAEYNNLVMTLLDHKATVDDDGPAVPHKVVLDTEATEARRVFHNSIEKMMVDGAGLEDVRDIASKAVSQTVKLALVLHVASAPHILTTPASAVNIETWRTAEALGLYHLQEAIRIQRFAEGDPSVNLARRILSWLIAKGKTEITARELCQSGPRPRPKARDAQEALVVLVDHGWVRPRSEKVGRGIIYALNPAACSQCSQRSQGGGEK